MTRGGRAVRVEGRTRSKEHVTSTPARVVRASSSTAACSSSRTHCAGAMSLMWKNRSMGSRELSKVVNFVVRYARAADFIFFRVGNASCTNWILAELVNPHSVMRSMGRLYCGIAPCLETASVMNSLVWPGPRPGGSWT